jgi:electron transfer flavoprotein beta subunit
VNIVVCVKQVPDTTDVRIDPETNALIRDGVASILNPFDENGVETALQLREKHGGKVTVISMGPPQATAVLRHTIAMGADEAYLISDPAVRGSDTLATSYTLARAIRHLGEFDLVICGKQAIDGDTAQVGPGVAERLNLPQVTLALAVEIEGRKARVTRMLDSANEVVEVRLPVLLTVVKQINEPRHPPMRGVMKAKKAEIPVLSAQDLNLDPKQTGFPGSPTVVWKIFTPRRRQRGEMLEGDLHERIDALVQKILDMGVIGVSG